MALPTFVAVGTVLDSDVAGSPGMPAGTASGDVLLLFIETSNEAVTVSGGNQTWVEVTGSPVSGTNADTAIDTRVTVFWARRGATAPTSPTTSDSGDHQRGAIIAIRGCKATGNPWVDTPVATSFTTAASSSAVTGLTTTVADTLVVIGVGTGDNQSIDAASNAALATPTVRLTDDGINQDNSALGIITGGKATAGAVGTTTVTHGGASTGSRAFLLIPLTATTPATNKPVNVWNGTAWVDRQAVVKVWNGTAWVAKTLKVNNGTTWV